MITINNTQYRNLEEQVLKNEDDIAILKTTKNISDLGINIIQPEPLPSATSLPADYEGEYGDAYLVGTEAPFTLYIWTRSNQAGVTGYWFDYGPLNAPSVVPGPIGPQGIQGETGVRGSLWYSQSGAPTNTTNVNPYDQALDGSTGDIYQYNGTVWQLTGNIRGPQGLQGIQGIPGQQGPIGQTGPQGPKGDQGQFIQIMGTLENINQLPMPDSVPRYSAYLIPVSGVNHIYLLVGEGTSSSPIEWVDGGSFGGGGTNVTVDGVTQNSVELGYVPKISVNYQIGESTTVTNNGSEVTFSNMQTTGYNIGNEEIEGTGTIELPIADSDTITWRTSTNNKVLVAEVSGAVLDDITDSLAAIPATITITAPSTSTNGQLTQAQLSGLRSNKSNLLMFNNEVYSLQDDQNDTGYLVYSHLGYDNNTSVYMIKCITITISTRGWVLTTRTVMDPASYSTTSQMTTAINNAKPSNFASGKAGLVPAPTSTQYSANYYLKGNGTFGQLVMTYSNGTLTISKS